MAKMLGSDRGITVVAQDLLELSTTQKHKLGERLVRDERVYRYAYNQTEQLVNLAASVIYPKEDGVAGATTVHDAGNYEVTMGSVDTATSVAADYFAGGYLCYRSTRLYTHKIKSHPAADNAAELVLTLETPIVGHTITDATTTLHVYRSIWNTRGTLAGDGAGFGEHCCFLGQAAGGQVVPASRYYWLQTWGPIISSQVDFYGAAAGGTREVTAISSGALQMGASNGNQRVGFLLPDTYTLGTAGAALGDADHLVMLQICP